MTTGAVAAAAGFLLGVLWMDLMFDSQVRSGRGVLDESVLESIAGYYRRATTTRKKRTGSDSRNTSKLLQPVVTFLPPRTGRHTVLCSGARCAVGWEARTTGKCLSGRRTRRTSTGCVAAQGPAAVGGEGLRTGNFLSGRDAVPGALRPRGRSAGTDQPLLLRSF